MPLRAVEWEYRRSSLRVRFLLPPNEGLISL